MKNRLKSIAFIAGLVACVFLLPDGPMNAVPVLMGAAVLGALRLNRAGAVQLTRWAKKHPYKSQGLIAFIELVLLALSLVEGYNLRMMDVEISVTAACLYSAVLALGFLSVHFRPQRESFFLPREVERHRLAYTTIALSSLLLMAFVGNRMHDYYPDSPFALVLEKTDRAIFPDAEPLSGGTAQVQGTVLPPALASLEVAGRESLDFDMGSSKKDLKKAAKKLEKENKKALRKAKRELRKDYRAEYTAGMCALAVFLIILLVSATCAGICLLIYGVSEGIVTGIVGGPLLAAGSIWAIAKVAKWCKREQPVNAPRN